MADFRSDTMTQPTARMREAMAQADVGDDVFGEDPTINRLEQVGAEFLGMESAVFVPSGSMGNQVAVHVHCRPGDELICEERCHVYLYEGGSVARLSGTQIWPLRSPRGFPDAEQLASSVRTVDDHHPRSRLFVIENTHNMAGGTVLGPAAMAEVVEQAHRLGLLVHVDGARLTNAAVASGCAVPDLLGRADSVSMCLSKGMGAPVGSLVAGSRDFAHEARRARKALGGGMRQAGILAAAGLIAIEEGPALAVEDHRRAAELADVLSEIAAFEVVAPESNIVMVDLPAHQPVAVLEYLEKRGVRALQVGPTRLRFVTHRDVGDADVELCAEAVQAWDRETASTNRTDQ